MNFFLSLTIRLLVFLGVDALAEALNVSGTVPDTFQGTDIVLLGVLGIPLALAAVGKREARTQGGHTTAYVATLIAVGIERHNLGEGLAIGAS